MCRREIACVALIVGFLALVHRMPSARAQARTGLNAAKQKLAEARAATRAGRYAEAVRLSKEAQRLHDSAGTLCNIGIGYYNLSDWPRAELFLSRCLAREAELQQNVRPRIRSLHGKARAHLDAGDYARVELTVVPKNAVVTASAFSTDEHIVGVRSMWLPAGTHVVTAKATGFARTMKRITVEARTVAKLSMTLTKAAPPPVPPPAANRASRTGAPTRMPAASMETPPDSGSAFSPRNGLILGSVSLGAAIGFHVLALRTGNRAEELDPDSQAFRDERRKWWMLAVPAYAFYGVATVALTTTGYRWLRGRDKRSTKRSLVGVGIGPRRAFVRFRW